MYAKSDAGESSRSDPLPPVETRHDRLWYALIGLLAETPDRVQHSIEAVDKATQWPRSVVASFAGPVLSSRLMRPVRGQVQELLWRQRTIVDRWVEAGRKEELAGRRMVRSLTDEEIDRVLDYLGDKPEVREMITVQTLGAMDKALGEVRDQAQSADNRVDRAVSTLLRRKPSALTAAPPPRLPPARDARARASGSEEG